MQKQSFCFSFDLSWCKALIEIELYSDIYQLLHFVV